MKQVTKFANHFLGNKKQPLDIKKPLSFEIAPRSTEIESTWYKDKFYCFSLNIDGKTGWRLPTKEELHEIYESKSDNDFTKWEYWSATEYNSQVAWSELFTIGFQSLQNKHNDYLVRAIRDLKDN